MSTIIREKARKGDLVIFRAADGYRAGTVRQSSLGLAVSVDLPNGEVARLPRGFGGDRYVVTADRIDVAAVLAAVDGRTFADLGELRELARPFRIDRRAL